MKKAKNGMKWVCIGVAMVTASVVAGCGTKESKEPEAPAVASQAVPAPKKKTISRNRNSIGG